MNRMRALVRNHLRSMDMEWGKDWGPGWTYYRCDECGFQWSEKSRDCQSLSGSSCEECGEFASPSGYETHFEWHVDSHKNLLKLGE